MRRTRTAEFTEATMPDRLRSAHRTRARARIVVLEGQLLYRVLEPVPVETRLSPGHPGTVEPDVAHEVEPIGEVRFFVEFLH